MENAVNAVADAQLIFGGFKMNVRRTVLVSFPDDLVDELDDAGFLVALGDFLVFADENIQRLFLGHFVQRLSADAVIFFQRLFDFTLGRKREIDRTAGVEAHRIEHGGVERIADGDLEGAVLEVGGQGEKLEGDLGGDFVPGLGGNLHLAQVDERPAQDASQLLEEHVLAGAVFAADEIHERLGRAVLHGHAPGPGPVRDLFRGGQQGLGDNIAKRYKRHQVKSLTSSAIINTRINTQGYEKLRREVKVSFSAARGALPNPCGQARNRHPAGASQSMASVPRASGPTPPRRLARTPRQRVPQPARIGLDGPGTRTRVTPSKKTYFSVLFVIAKAERKWFLVSLPRDARLGNWRHRRRAFATNELNRKTILCETCLSKNWDSGSSCLWLSRRL